MLEQLQQARIPLEKIEVNPSKQQSIERKLAALLALVVLLPPTVNWERDFARLPPCEVPAHPPSRCVCPVSRFKSRFKSNKNLEEMTILHFTLKGCVTNVVIIPLYTRRHLSEKN